MEQPGQQIQGDSHSAGPGHPHSLDVDWEKALAGGPTGQEILYIQP